MSAFTKVVMSTCIVITYHFIPLFRYNNKIRHVKTCRILEGVDTLDPPLYSTEKRQKTQKINFFAQNFALDLTGIVVNSATKFLYGYYSIRPKFCPVFSTKNFQEMFWNVNRVMGRKVTHKKIAPMPPGLRTSVLFFCRQPIFSMAGLRPARTHRQTVF